MYRTTIRSIVALLAVSVFAAEDETTDALPPLHQAVQYLQVDIEALRYFAGAARPDAATVPIRYAGPRHLFWLAQAIFSKANQLAEEMAEHQLLPLDDVQADWRRASPRPAPTGRSIEFADVQQLIDDAHDRVRAVLLLQKVRVLVSEPPPRDASATPAKVLRRIIQTSRYLDSMLRRELQPRDVYMRVLLAIRYAGDLGAGYPTQPVRDGTTMPDVYQRLVACLDLMKVVEEVAGVRVLDLDVDREMARTGVTPAGMYDLATILVSDLAYMAQQAAAPRTELPRGEYRMPRTVTAAHLHQLVGVLEAQLNVLAPGAAGEPGDAVAP